MVEIFKKIEGELTKLDAPEKDCWVNIYPPFDTETLEILSEQYQVPLDFLTDSIDINERSRFEVEDDIKLIVLNTPIVNEGELINDINVLYITIPIGVILTPEYVITISPYNNPVIDSFINKRIKRFDPANKTRFVLQLLDRNVFYFLHYLKQINNKRTQYEEELYNSSRNNELLELMNLQKSLVYFVTTLRANELLMMKMQRVDLLALKDDEEQHDLFQDILVDNSQALEMSNVYTNILNGTLDAFASIISNNLNVVMKRLTSVTIVLMVPTLVTSFYGMNMKLPVSEGKYAYLFVLLLSTGLATMLAWFFLRKRWF
ncbi:MAG: magnesium transporter CorA family protein [Chitinophagales bacterium]|nr:magnesium transporter CorA family protein [Chitinophagales bacterium]